MNASVQTHSGRLQGAAESGVSVYRGIAYAEAPVGPLRWRAPQPVKAWQGVRNATEFGANCLQPDAPRDNGLRQGPASEDCLTLNIWIPTDAGRTPSLPVMVWIHGGSFTGGSGSAALYDGAALARRGVVVVTLNYRLGRFGFFAHPALTRESHGEPLANYGLMDQIAALSWVQSNIAQFGGDAKKVTLFGESAGGVAVQHLMLAPGARGLFSRAISQSGRGLEKVATLESAQANGVAFVARLGLVDVDAKSLRAIDAVRIAEIPAPTIDEGFGPVIDGQVVRSTVWEGFSKGLQAQVPFIVGFNSHELPGAFLGDTSKREASLGLNPEVRERLVNAYGGEAGFKDRFFGDYWYAAPALKIAQAHAKSGAPTYAYRFDFVSASMRNRLKGAPHASDRQYVFDTLGSSPWPTTQEDVVVAQMLGEYWSDFAKLGQPGGTVKWPLFDTEKVMDFSGAGPVVRALEAVAPPTFGFTGVYP